MKSSFNYESDLFSTFEKCLLEDDEFPQLFKFLSMFPTTRNSHLFGIVCRNLLKSQNKDYARIVLNYIGTVFNTRYVFPKKDAKKYLLMILKDLSENEWVNVLTLVESHNFLECDHSIEEQEGLRAGYNILIILSETNVTPNFLKIALDTSYEAEVRINALALHLKKCALEVYLAPFDENSFDQPKFRNLFFEEKCQLEIKKHEKLKKLVDSYF